MKNTLLIFGIVLFTLIVVYYIITQRSSNVNVEKYTSFNTHLSDSNEATYFFILQKANENWSIQELDDCVIGYVDEEHLSLFQKILQIYTDPIKPNSIQYNKLDEITKTTWDTVNVILFVGTKQQKQNQETLVNHKMIEYFPKKNLDRIETVFPKSQFDIYGDSNTTTFLLNLSRHQSAFYIYQTEQIVEFDPKFAFVLSGKIDGTYTQTSLTEDTIVMNRTQIDGLNVEIGEKIFIKHQKNIAMNGAYFVTDIHPILVLTKKIDVKSNTPICVNLDETHYKEYTSKYSCEHPNNVIGRPKEEPLYWRTVCQRDYECKKHPEKMEGCVENRCSHSSHVQTDINSVITNK